MDAGSLRDNLFQVWQRYQEVKEKDLLLRVGFVTLADYLHELHMISCELQPAGSSAALYLAAAVSDFYLPTTLMATHKIQSADGPLTLNLQRVPKMLKELCATWCPEAFVISFKVVCLFLCAAGSSSFYPCDDFIYMKFVRFQ